MKTTALTLALAFTVLAVGVPAVGYVGLAAWITRRGPWASHLLGAPL